MSADVGLLEHRGQAIERRLGDHPVNARDSASNSSSVAHCSRSASSTSRRNSRRAAASSLVTSRRRQAEASRELGVGRAIALVGGQIVLLEDREANGMSARVARRAQPIRCAGKQAAQPLAVKIGVEVVDQVAGLERELAFRLAEVDRNQRDAAAALEARVGLARVGDEAVEAGAQVGAESARGTGRSRRRSPSRTRAERIACVRSAASSGGACHFSRTYLKTGFQYAVTSVSNAERRSSARGLRIAATIECRVAGKADMNKAILARLLQSARMQDASWLMADG